MNDTNNEVKVVRYGELVPCKTAFIDAHTPGSNQKENFTIIGAGVSESPDQHIHIKDTPGFNIGAAGQPPKCTNSLHTHSTAEVFFVLKGRWRFFWGNTGDAGDVILEEGDLINIPTSVFRGFENVGNDYGMIMAVLGGDDAGGGVVWAPQVLEEAKKYGLLLDENGRLYDSKKGQQLPAGVAAVTPMTQTEMKKWANPAAAEVVPSCVARYQDMMAIAEGAPAKVIAGDGLLVDKPGFELDLIKRDSIGADSYTIETHEVLMVMRGHWRLAWASGEVVLAEGDTCLVAPHLEHSLEPSMSGEASLFRIRKTDDPARR